MKKALCPWMGRKAGGLSEKNSGQGEVRALQILNVYSNDYGICLSQKFIGEKTNEIPAAQEILRLMDLKDMIVTADTSWFREKKKWKKVTSFGVVHKKLEKADGTKEEEWRYYICSIGGNVDEFQWASRGHWRVEVNLHWHLDFTFCDDKNTSMGKASAKNLQIMKKIALAILSLVKESYKISMKRIGYELSLDYENEIERMLSMLDIESVKKALYSEKKSVIK